MTLTCRHVAGLASFFKVPRNNPYCFSSWKIFQNHSRNNRRFIWL